MKIGVIGSGYVGLVTGACFAHLGHTVICVDQDKAKIKSLKAGIVPFFEPGLQEIVTTNIKKKRLSFSSEISSIVNRCEVLFISVNTPAKANGEADLGFVGKVARQIAERLKKYCLIVEKSTIPVGTGEWVRKTIISHAKKGVQFDVASNPEFLREGTAVRDFLNPDRIVIGVSTARAEKIFRTLYSTIKAPLIVTDIKSAELIKHASNSFLATKISFINAVSRVCDETGADVENVALGMGLDTRIGKSFLRAGIGFGGSCFPKDVSAFFHISKKLNVPFELLGEVLRINNEQAMHFVSKIRKDLKTLKGKTIAILGLAFKSDTDDMRSAPSIPIIRALQKEGARIQAYDPEAIEKASKILLDVDYVISPYHAARGAHAVAVLTEWGEFLNLDWDHLKRMMKDRFFFDGRNLFSPQEMKLLGFKYRSMGRPTL